MSSTKAIASLRKRLERWELDHLRQLAGSLASELEAAHEHIEKLKAEADHAWRTADSWREDAISALNDLEANGAQIGLTQDGRVVVAASVQATPAAAAHGEEARADRLSAQQAIGPLLGDQARLPDHFEAFTAVQVYDYFLQHGVECTLDFAAQLQRDLAAQKLEDSELGARAQAHNEKALGAVQGDNGSGVHAGSVGTTPPADGDAAATAAHQAVHHLLQRIQRDPQLAHYFAPITRSMDELTEAEALLHGLDLEQFRKDYYSTLIFKEPVCGKCGGAA